MADQTGGMTEEVLLPILRYCSNNRLLESGKTNDVCHVNLASVVDRNGYFSKTNQACYRYSMLLCNVM
jgi:hypothetical protein